MRKMMIGVLTLTAAAGLMSVLGRATEAQTAPSSAAAPHTTLLAAPSQKLDDALLEWPLQPGQQAYGKIDGKHLHRYVVEQAAIARGIAIKATRSSGDASSGAPLMRRAPSGSRTNSSRSG